jgi:hypothetical protein
VVTWNTFRQLDAVLGVAVAGLFILAAMHASLDAKLTALALRSGHGAELTAALLRGDWSVICGLPPDIQTLVFAQIGPIFVAGTQTTFLVTAAGNFVCVFAALLFMPRTAAA